MSWQAYYRERQMTADEAVRLIASGSKVVFSHDAAEPMALVEALVKNAKQYKDVQISHIFSLGEGEYARPEYREHFRLNLWFLSQNTRHSVNSGYGDYTPMFFFETPALIREGVIPVDTALIMVTPPNEEGKVSTGVSADYTVQAVKSASLVIAQVNDQVPFTFGDAVFDVEEIDYFVETNQPLPVLSPAPVGPVEEAIGAYCAGIIEDGDCLQLGIGAIPDAVCHALEKKKHLGIHSEMLGDGILRLYQAGAVDNSRKQIDRGKFVFNFVMGTKAVYDFCHNNENCLLKSVDYVNHPYIISQNDNMVSINGALGIDLYGQIASDTIGYQQFSGIGGQVDFVRGAAMSRGGRSIIAMPSVTRKKDGTMLSKITPILPEGQVVSTSRQDTDYVATEYGIVRLKGKTVKERACALISIAHPDFHEELKDGFQKMFREAF